MTTCTTKKELINLCKSNKMFINSLHYESNIINAVIISYEAQQKGLYCINVREGVIYSV